MYFPQLRPIVENRHNRRIARQLELNGFVLRDVEGDDSSVELTHVPRRSDLSWQSPLATFMELLRLISFGESNMPRTTDGMGILRKMVPCGDAGARNALANRQHRTAGKNDDGTNDDVDNDDDDSALSGSEENSDEQFERNLQQWSDRELLRQAEVSGHSWLQDGCLCPHGNVICLELKKQ